MFVPSQEEFASVARRLVKQQPTADRQTIILGVMRHFKGVGAPDNVASAVDKILEERN